ncbi:hypothetical protein VT03_00775 [Planctomyces sp. SH-PL14]|nr:hypothetical protein VT03_00775 [Planctomyces sp. SH-PL14]
MRGFRRLGIAALTLIVLSMPKAMIHGEEKATSQTKTGVVQSVDPVARTIVVMVTREMTFAVTANTQIAEGDISRTLADVAVGDTVRVVYSLNADRARVASSATVLPATVLPVTTAPVGGPAGAEPQSPLRPGQIFSLQFPDLPATFDELVEAKGIKPQMTVFLPSNYAPDRKHPLLVFLNGGTGGRGDNPGIARALVDEADFVCVSLPLFHQAAPGSAGYDVVIRDADGRYMWPFYKRMLAELGRAVPNLDPARRVIGGTSNGAHAVQAIVDQSDGEAAEMFSAFFLVNGGGRLQRYDLLKEKPLLLAYGDKTLRASRLSEIVAAAKSGGTALTAYEMKGVGHAFPASEYPAIRKWLRGEAIGQTP